MGAGRKLVSSARAVLPCDAARQIVLPKTRVRMFACDSLLQRADERPDFASRLTVPRWGVYIDAELSFAGGFVLSFEYPQGFSLNLFLLRSITPLLQRNVWALKRTTK